MNDLAFKHFDDKKRVTWGDLKHELDSINEDISTINNMEVSEEAKSPILTELKNQANEVKEKMHDYIDSL